MIRGYYIAATGMDVQRKDMEVITNNITNVETSGYKKDEMVSISFEDVMIQRINDEQILNRTPEVGPLNFGTHVDYVHTMFGQGIIEVTDFTTDLAIEGDAFFVIDTAEGESYTRSGAFNVNADGYLVDGNGSYLIGDNGRIQVGGTDFGVNEDGQIYADGELVATLQMVTFEDLGSLRKQGSNVYTAPAGTAIEATDYRIRQGALEGSNVEISREMVDMMTIYRAYESNQKMLTMIDETLGKAVTEIGRLR